VPVRVGNSETAQKSVNQPPRRIIPRRAYEEAPDSGRPMPMDVDRMASALKAEVFVPKRSCAGREGSLERLESPQALAALGDQGQMTTSDHRGTGEARTPPCVAGKLSRHSPDVGPNANSAPFMVARQGLRGPERGQYQHCPRRPCARRWRRVIRLQVYRLCSQMAAIGWSC
jgi:hypothetical protein